MCNICLKIIFVKNTVNFTVFFLKIYYIEEQKSFCRNITFVIEREYMNRGLWEDDFSNILIIESALTTESALISALTLFWTIKCISS